MLKKTSDAVNKYIVFFIDFSLIFREASMTNRAKRLKIGLAHKNRQKSTLGTHFFRKKSIFGRFLGPRGDPEINKNLRVVPGKGVLGAIW